MGVLLSRCVLLYMWLIYSGKAKAKKSAFARHAYFGIILGDQDNLWSPHKVYRTCIEGLRLWKNGKKWSMLFWIPMVWREPRNHEDYCYFCTVKVKGYNAKTRKGIIYPNINSANRPIPHGPEVPIPSPLDVVKSSSSSSEPDTQDTHLYQPETKPETEPKPLSQSGLDDIVRNLNWPQDSAEYLSSKLKYNNFQQTTYGQ